MKFIAVAVFNYLIALLILITSFIVIIVYAIKLRRV